MSGSADFMRSIARKGGLTTKARHGAKHFSEVGAMGGHAGKGKPRRRERKAVIVTAAPAITRTAVLQTIDEIIADMERAS